jgi:hypothetical protein
MKAIIEDGRCFVPLKSVAMFVAAFWFLVIAKPLKPGHQMTLRSSQRFTERSRAQLSGDGYSSWAILYAWTNNKLAKIWLPD